MTTIFKCAEREEHVDEVDINNKDLADLMGFLTHFEVPLSDELKAAYRVALESNDHRVKHDVAHMLLDRVIWAYDSGHRAFLNGDRKYWGCVIQQLRLKQRECRG